MQNSTNKGVSKSNNLDDDEEFHNDDYSDEDKQSKFSDNKERNKFKKQITGKSGKADVHIPPLNDSSDDTEGDSDLSLGYNNEKNFTLKEFYDYDDFPESTGSAILPWTEFTRDFMSLDIAMTPAVKQYCEDTPDSWIDLRPYMIENPEKCTRYDFLPKVLARFRHMHLRHLCVTNPTNGQLEGVITRQDIFLWMPM